MKTLESSPFLFSRKPIDSKSISDIHDCMPLILDKEDVKEWIRPDGDPFNIAERALTNMVFEKAVEYHKSPTEFIAM